MRKKKDVALIIVIFALLFLLAGLLLITGQKKNDDPQEPIVPDDPITSYTLTFDVFCDGIKYDNYSVDVKKNEYYTVSPKFQKEGYSFLYWGDGTTEKSFQIQVKGDMRFEEYYVYSLSIPRVDLTTDGGKAITSKDEYLGCSLSLTARYDECLDEVRASIRCRGYTSYYYAEKKSFRIKFDEKQSIFGGTKHRDFTLIANQLDKTSARNSIAYELSEAFSNIQYTTMHEWVEVYINGSYEGIYLFCDQIEEGKDKIELSDDMTSVNTGYLLELNMRSKDDPNAVSFLHSGLYYEIKDPNFKETNPRPYINYIFEYLSFSINSIYGGSWENVEYFIDIPSFIDTYIINELMGNIDCGAFSFYLYKDKDGKLYSGPVWDFDLAAGHVNYGMGNVKNCPPDQGLYAKEVNGWYAGLMVRSEFSDQVHDRLVSMQDTVKQILSLLDTSNPNGYYLQYQEQLEENATRWNIFRKDVHYWPNINETAQVKAITTVKGQYDYLYDWLTRRYDYMLSVI